MSERVPPALARKANLPGGQPAPPIRPPNVNITNSSSPPDQTWLQSFKFPTVLSALKLPMLDSIPPKKRQVYIAMSVATTISMGGFLTWYIYSLLRSSPKNTQLKVKSIEPSLAIGELLDGEMDPRNKIFNAELKRNNVGGDGVLILHQCPRGRRTPCIAPYPLKLETFLRIHGIKYEVDFNNLEPRTADAPWITLDLEDICDSQNCLRFLVERYELNLEKGLSEADKAHLRAYTHLLENHLYWGIALWRWVYDGARSLAEIQLLPSKTLEMIPQICKTVEQAAWFHGIGKKSPRDVTEAVGLDLVALSHLLGKKPYFFGPNPSELDCTAFAMLAQMLWNMEGSPYEKTIKDKHKNLVEFCWRIRTQFWPDWESCLNNQGFDQ